MTRRKPCLITFLKIASIRRLLFPKNQNRISVLKYNLSILFFALIAQYAGAQDVPLVTVSADSSTFSQVAEALEKQTGYRVFYKNEWVDALRYDFSLSRKPLGEVLDTLLRETTLNYYIGNGQVFITKDVRILTRPGIAGLLESNPSGIQTNVEKGLIFTREYRYNADGDSDAGNHVVEIGNRQKLKADGKATIAGYVKEAGTGDPVSGVLVYSETPMVTTTTDERGLYSIMLPVGKNKLTYQLIGMKPEQRNLVLFSDGQLNVKMEADVRALQEIVIQSDRAANIENAQMGISNLKVEEVKNVPVVLGERDVMKVATTLAGINTAGEGAAGFNVRGGKADQNLITMDGAPIYNTSHFLGFFSVFNSEAIEDMQIYKGSIPAMYGGRLSSVIDLSSRRANRDSISGSGGISPITSKIMLEVPLFKGRAGIMMGGRTTYSNWILKQIKNADFNQNRVSFSDFIFRSDYDINPRNKIRLSGYYSVDDFNMKSDTLFSASDFRYQNLAASVGFLHQFSEHLSSSMEILYSGYQYGLRNNEVPENAFFQDFNIFESTVKGELNYSRFDLHDISGGIEVKKIKSNPGAKSPLGPESIVKEQKIAAEQALESAAFISDQYTLSPKATLYVGLRYSMFTSLGPQTVYAYSPGTPKNGETRTDSVEYGKGEKIEVYQGFEPRISARFKIDNQSSLKGGYIRTRQYVHTLTNSASLSPTDIWRLSGAHLYPQVADQFSFGYYRNFNYNTIETSVEAYYKKIQNLLDFKVGSEFLLNPHVETVTLQGPGKSYGLEVSVKKSGRLNGWVNYTFSRTFIKLDSEHAEERINGGVYYPTNYDIPHSANLVANYKLTRRLSFSYNFAFRSGRPITYPEGVYDIHGSPSVHYSDRNSYRIPYYMRMDLGVNLEAGHKLGKLAYSYWSFSIYNLLGRDNPYSVFFNVEKGEIKGYKLIVFGVPIPTLTYNFKF